MWIIYVHEHNQIYSHFRMIGSMFLLFDVHSEHVLFFTLSAIISDPQASCLRRAITMLGTSPASMLRSWQVALNHVAMINFSCMKTSQTYASLLDCSSGTYGVIWYDVHFDNFYWLWWHWNWFVCSISVQEQQVSRIGKATIIVCESASTALHPLFDDVVLWFLLCSYRSSTLLSTTYPHRTSEEHVRMLWLLSAEHLGWPKFWYATRRTQMPFI